LPSEHATTAKDLLEQFPATIALRELGFTDGQFNQVSFHHKDRCLPVSQRRLSMPSALTEDRTLIEIGRILTLFNQFAMFRYAVLDGYQEKNPDLDGAWRHVNDALVDWRRRKHLEQQRQNASKRRRITPEIQGNSRTPIGMKEFVGDFANKPENRPLTPSELWPRFRSHMADFRLDPVVKGRSYHYLNGKLCFGTFCNYVRDARKKTQQQRG